MRTKTACPNWAPDDIKAGWDNWTEAARQSWVNMNPPGTKVFTKPNSPDAPTPDPSKVARLENGRVTTVYEEKPVTEWDRDMELNGKVVPAKRIRYAILELIGKSEWYATNISNGFVERKLEKILSDSTPGWEPPEADPLVVERTQRTSEGDAVIREIRELRTPEEREQIRKKFGVNAYTFKKLAKKDCKICGGRGLFDASQYPDHPLYKNLDETFMCNCVFE